MPVAESLSSLFLFSSSLVGDIGGNYFRDETARFFWGRLVELVFLLPTCGLFARFIVLAFYQARKHCIMFVSPFKERDYGGFVYRGCYNRSKFEIMHPRLVKKKCLVKLTLDMYTFNLFELILF